LHHPAVVRVRRHLADERERTGDAGGSALPGNGEMPAAGGGVAKNVGARVCVVAVHASRPDAFAAVAVGLRAHVPILACRPVWFCRWRRAGGIDGVAHAGLAAVSDVASARRARSADAASRRAARIDRARVAIVVRRAVGGAIAQLVAHVIADGAEKWLGGAIAVLLEVDGEAREVALQVVGRVEHDEASVDARAGAPVAGDPELRAQEEGESPMRRVVTLVMLLRVLVAGSPVAAANYLYVAGEPGDQMLEGGQVLVTGASAGFEPQVRFFPDGVAVTAYAHDATWVVLMEMPDGMPLKPGTYASASGAFLGSGTFPVGPSHLEVYGSKGCTGGDYGTVASTGRFVLRRVVTYQSSLVELVADFEQRCVGATGSIRGTVVLEGGAIACFNQPTGTACDDFDPCTRDDVCQGGICAGVDEMSPTCTAPDDCHDAGVCDRQLARCIAPLRADGASCDDGSACTTDDRCDDGRCAGGAPVDCDDDYVCTTDRCDADAGCRHEAAPGSCWVFRPVTRGVAVGTGAGGTARCTLRCQSIEPVMLLLGPDASYRFQGTSTAICPSGASVLFPDEVGTARSGRRGRLFLEPSNLDEVMAALRRCAGAGVRRNGYRQWVKRDGDRLEGRAVVRGRTRAGGMPVSLVLRERFTAVPALDPRGMPVDPPLTDGEAPFCSVDLTPRCRRE
jgi:hypothetical protein